VGAFVVLISPTSLAARITESAPMVIQARMLIDDLGGRSVAPPFTHGQISTTMTVDNGTIVLSASFFSSPRPNNGPALEQVFEMRVRTVKSC
jgi:hypothetical protein